MLTDQSQHTKNIRLGFANARSGQVNFSLPLSVISERCDAIRNLDFTFATDTILPTRSPQVYPVLFQYSCYSCSNFSNFGSYRHSVMVLKLTKLVIFLAILQYMPFFDQ